MDIPADTVKERTRHTKAYKIPDIDVSGLIGLSSRLKGEVLRDFNHDYGNFLSILNTSFDPMALITLFQFYDPHLRCFTFQDYQLVLTLEEFSYILNIRITDDVPFIRVPEVVRFEKIAEALHMGIKEVERNWKSSGGVSGFYLCFLISRAKDAAKKEQWVDFSRLLAIMIYGIVLFPSRENFVSLAAICVFMNKNPVPTLLADAYFSIHSRSKKGEYVVGSCLPFLYQWFMLHLPVRGPFVLKKSSLKWSDRIVNLTSYDIRWNYCVGKIWNIITSCGQYPNVPLMGTRGCISYNPTLAYRQLGYAMERAQNDVEAFESVYFADGKDPLELEKISYAWTKVHRRDQTTLSKKVPIAMGPYRKWVEARVANLLLPFARSCPLYGQPPVVLTDTVAAELYIQAEADNIKLKAKDNEVGLERYFQDHEKAELVRKLKHAQGEGSNMTRAQRRSHDLMEESLYRKQQECAKLRRSENNSKRKVQDSEKQLIEEKAKSARLEEELTRLRAQRRGDGRAHFVIRRS
ncbi:uncharacterized protein LOC131657334 [Vicia villosa]|uniref:uncharacterized protein LOC131657334 n=1 Tax=Vicia villosa TaxID=3911 RepID=UPI00273AC1E8|nr:uncharacterized protein LOC131657334 [Vicia villosa]